MQNSTKLQLIEGGRVKRKLVLNDAVKESIATRFQYHGATLSTLAWETGHSQGALCAVIVEIARKEAIEVGRRIERNMNRFQLPIAA